MRPIVWALLVLMLFSLSSCSPVDVSGVVTTSDVDNRFSDSAALPEKADVSIAGADFSFIVLADTHISQGVTANLTALSAKLCPEDQLILICGDITQSGAVSDFAALNNVMGQIGLPYYTSIGNHDLFFGGWNNYRQYLGRSCYSFKAGPMRVICLDSANGTLGNNQKNWLENLLKTKTEPLCFVFTHDEFFSPGFPNVQQYTDIAEIYYLMHLFETYQVNMVFMGHSHKNYDRVVNGVHYINQADLADSGGSKAFLRVRVSGASVTYERVQLQ